METCALVFVLRNYIYYNEQTKQGSNEMKTTFGFALGVFASASVLAGFVGGLFVGVSGYRELDKQKAANLATDAQRERGSRAAREALDFLKSREN